MMVHIGLENFIHAEDIVAIIKPDSSPAKKLRWNAEDTQMLINATGGRKPRSLIVMKSNHLILSALQTTTMKERIVNQKMKLVE